MGDSENPFQISRGVKRKLFSDTKSPFARRLAAARKAPKHVDVDPDVEADDASALKVKQELDTAHPSEDDFHLQKDAHYSKLYRGETDFAAVAAKDKPLQFYLKGERHLDFTDPKAVVQLTKSLLKVDFGLTFELPDDRLCPPVPNRHNYILWIKALLDSSSTSYSELYNPERKVEGLDIGTGASAIYPLLGCTQRPGWSFIATDIDHESLSWARRNVAINELESRIQLLQRSPTDNLIPLDNSEVACLDFVMTNPPFYSSESELLELAKTKAQPPNSACTGAAHEMVCDGGEVQFFQRIFDESCQLKNRVQWYTIMLGKQSSLELVVRIIQRNGIDNYALAQFVQGTKTRRWAVGWSFAKRRPNAAACRGFEPSAGKKLLPHPTEMTVATKSTRPNNAEQVQNMFWTQLEDVTDGLDLVSWNMDEDRLRVVGFAQENVWSRSYRRRTSALGKQRSPEAGNKKPVLSECPFGFAITVTKSDPEEETGDDAQSTVDVVVRWLQGSDYTLFESFAGMVRNTLLRVV
ncbi:hypothetical protein PFICI_12837 [Pestalotiopsis fici W106-1]|uniref:U6 small nuclear RNA (adenine-(43)-N(6))-methyltransferase n=1 Tax=Pestalotiopsis fici (strain W106-1 / CGMCC3.15140) TaxID=1229662 RepID=W3WPV5_PESFW|nr:uncharacterized protein PFICI_12837 [Pestalotiopsis fici W106-1]ETS75893.1 hypothetical protein PFICI_12837 [Pestalotiopsis fici W106-1]